MQPYQFLFPLGLSYGFYGAVIWILFWLGKLPYPGLIHAHLMIGGFLFSFANGFLMTAVPRFTGSLPAASWELAMAVAINAVGLVLGATGGSETLFYAVAFTNIGLLAIFIGRRFSRRSFAPPPHFGFLPLGILSGLTGAALMVGVNTGRISGELRALGRLLLFQDVMLCFIAGIGAGLIAALLGWGPPPTVQVSRVSLHRRGGVLREPVLGQSVLFVSGILFEALGFSTLGRLCRAIAVTWIGLSSWKLHRRPRVRGRLANWLWTGAWSLVIGLWVHAFAPLSWGVHALHLVFVSGLGLMTLMVASRVTLAHGGYDLEIEHRSRAIRITGVLVVLAAATRIYAPVVPATYFSHLAYAAMCWIAGLVIWAVVFVPKMVRPQ